MATRHIFVYGTLREGSNHEMYHVLATHSVFKGAATARGWLYSLGNYPGLTCREDTTDTVKGELYEIDSESLEALFRVLDDYEGLGPQHPQPHDYRRELVRVTLEGGRQLEAWAYVLTRSPERLERIPSGDFLAWRRARA